MYIPIPPRRPGGLGPAPRSAPAVELDGLTRRGIDSSSQEALSSRSAIRRRSDGDTGTTIGVVVGVVLALFVAGVIAFCWYYRVSIRTKAKKRRRRRRRRRHRKSSKGSSSSSEGAAPPPPPPAEPPADKPAE